MLCCMYVYNYNQALIAVKIWTKFAEFKHYDTFGIYAEIRISLFVFILWIICTIVSSTPTIYYEKWEYFVFYDASTTFWFMIFLYLVVPYVIRVNTSDKVNPKNQSIDDLGDYMQNLKN